MAIITRAGKGSALTHAELDTNITENMQGGNLYTDSGAYSFGPNINYNICSMNASTVRARYALRDIAITGGPAVFYFAFFGSTNISLFGFQSRFTTTSTNGQAFTRSGSNQLTVSGPSAYMVPQTAVLEIERGRSTFGSGTTLYDFRFTASSYTSSYQWIGSGRVLCDPSAYVTGIGFRMSGYSGTAYCTTGYTQV